jgi:hypothetical protein
MMREEKIAVYKPETKDWKLIKNGWIKALPL